MFKISIPQPCHEDWNKMNPNDQGRHCSSCAKTVVDFTGMSDDEVKYFFLHKKEERVCGRFKQTQLQQMVIELPQNIFNIEMPLWKRFLVACLVAFSTTLFSCDTKINENTLINTEAKDLNSSLAKRQDLVNGNISITDTIPVPVEESITIVGDIIPKEVMLGGLEFTIIPEDSIKPKVCKPLQVDKPSTETILTGDTILTKQPDPVLLNKQGNDLIFMGLPVPVIKKRSKNDSLLNITKPKNPPGTDSLDCNTTIYY